MVLVIIIGTPADAWACSCTGASPCALYNRATAVFLGQIVDVRREGAVQFARIQVTRVWKGTVNRLVTIRNEAGTSCSFQFTPGGRFLVYGSGTQGEFAVHMCAGGGPLDEDEPDPDLPPLEGSVTGKVVRLSDRYMGPDSKPDPIAGARVWIVTAAHIVETRSDATGSFILQGVPLGDHTVNADVGADEEASARVSLEFPSDCSEVLIVPRPSGRLAGTLISAEGEPVVGAVIHAVPASHDWSRNDLSDVRRSISREDGAFEFRGLKPGKHFLVVNVLESPSVSHPFAPTYYPGVEKREEAALVEIGHGDAAPLRPFVLRQRLPRTRITAQVLCRDQSVPQSAIVFATAVDERSVYSESTYERVDGVFRIPVLLGVTYDVHAEIFVPAAGAAGQPARVTTLRTPPIRVHSAAPAELIHLVAARDRCEQTTIDGSRR